MNRKKIATLAELKELDEQEIVEGYLSGFSGDPEPGNNRSESFWHGWRNGASDKSGKTDRHQRFLAVQIINDMRVNQILTSHNKHS